MDFDFSQTYLYKLHRLTSSLDSLFDQKLRQYSDIGLSQFTLLLSVQQHQPADQRTIARFLDLSPGAISRQVEIARANKWLSVRADPKDRRGHILKLTAAGEQKIAHGLDTLWAHVFSIFDDENRQTNLMEHIDLLQGHINKIKRPYILYRPNPVI